MRTRDRAGRWAGLLVALVGCGEAEVEVAEFAELCGVAGPVRVLEHAEDHAVIYRHRRVGERLVFDIGPVHATSGSGLYALDRDSQIWTTGLCGESPTRLDERFKALFVIERWPDVALVCGDGNISALSGEGLRDVHVVFPGTNCVPYWTRHGLILPDFAEGLDFYPYPDDPLTQTSAPIKLPVEVRVDGAEPRMAEAGDGLLVLQPDGELVHVDVRDLTVTSVQAGVGDFVASPSGRYVLWRGPSARGGAVDRRSCVSDRADGRSARAGHRALQRAGRGALGGVAGAAAGGVRGVQVMRAAARASMRPMPRWAMTSVRPCSLR